MSFNWEILTNSYIIIIIVKSISVKVNVEELNLRFVENIRLKLDNGKYQGLKLNKHRITRSKMAKLTVKEIYEDTNPRLRLI